MVWTHTRARLSLILSLVILILRRKAIGKLGQHRVEVVVELLIRVTHAMRWGVLGLAKELLPRGRRLPVLIVRLRHVVKLRTRL